MVQKSYAKQDKDDLGKIKAVIKTTLNLFDKAVNENVLLSIRIGRAFQRNGEEYLLTIKMKARKEEMHLCIKCMRFEGLIKKVKIRNFAAENILKMNKPKQVAEIANIKGYVWK